MFLKIMTIVFYAAIALWGLGVGFPYLELFIGVSAAVLAVAHAVG